MTKETILSVKNLHVTFKTYAGDVQAIRDINFDLKKGETLAIVGEQNLFLGMKGSNFLLDEPLTSIPQ